jgi:hypothetical protein
MVGAPLEFVKNRDGQIVPGGSLFSSLIFKRTPHPYGLIVAASGYGTLAAQCHFGNSTMCYAIPVPSPETEWKGFDKVDWLKLTHRRTLMSHPIYTEASRRR